MGGLHPPNFGFPPIEAPFISKFSLDHGQAQIAAPGPGTHRLEAPQSSVSDRLFSALLPPLYFLLRLTQHIQPTQHTYSLPTYEHGAHPSRPPIPHPPHVHTTTTLYPHKHPLSIYLHRVMRRIVAGLQYKSDNSSIDIHASWEFQSLGAGYYSRMKTL